MRRSVGDTFKRSVRDINLESPLGTLSKGPLGTCFVKSPLGTLSKGPLGTCFVESPLGTLSKGPLGTLLKLSCFNNFKKVR